MREEELDRQFSGALKAIRMDDEVLEWVAMVLREGQKDEKQYHDEMIGKLQRRYQKLQNRIDAMYVDKLDGKISQSFYEQKSEEWRAEQTSMLQKLKMYENANRSYLDDGVHLLELAQKASRLYEGQEMAEKRRLLNFALSNSTWKNGMLTANYRKPFDLLAITNSDYQKRNTASRVKSGVSGIWLRRRDSNPRQGG